MLTALLYHKIGDGKYANPLPQFEAHLKWIAAHYPTVLPGDKLPEGTSVCLTFDDAFFDFYHFVFPLLKKYNLKALLSVPTAFIPLSTSFSPEKRLEKVATFPDKAPPLPSPAFCTWDELKTLSDSPLIQIASHSLHHRPLISPDVDPKNELTASKDLLESNLGLTITTFVYPFGIFNKAVHTLAQKHYKIIMRIGEALNRSWSNSNNLCYRINADRLPHPNYPFSNLLHFKYTARYILNTLRKK